MVISAAALALLTVPAIATAQEPAPQDNPGVGAYTETVPEPDGDKSTRNNGDGGLTVDDDADNADDVLSDDTEDTLADQGAAGTGASDLAESGSPGSAKDSKSSDDSKPSDDGNGSDAEQNGSVDDQSSADLASEASSSGPGGLGVALPIVLVLSLLAAIGVRFFRRRTDA